MSARNKQLVAAGFIVFRRFQGEIQYLLLQASYGKHHWSSPKGHLDDGETEIEAAYRETSEESGITKDQLIIHDYQKVMNYNVRGQSKRVVYWVAEVPNVTISVQLSDESQDFGWFNFAETIKLQPWADMNATMHDVNKYIQQLSAAAP